MESAHIMRGMSHEIHYSHLPTYQFHAPSCFCLYKLLAKDNVDDNDSDHNNDNKYNNKSVPEGKKTKKEIE